MISPGRAARFFAVCLALGACRGGGGSGTSVVDDRVEYYPVSGASAQELRWALDQVGPQNDEGGRSDAITKWHFEYTYSVSHNPRECRLHSIDTTATITMILPRWTPGPGASPELVRKWQDYVTCARLHESGHRRIYLDAIAQLRLKAGALGAFPDCDGVERALDVTATSLLARLKDDQLAYERRTDHGYAQCGRFP